MKAYHCIIAMEHSELLTIKSSFAYAYYQEQQNVTIKNYATLARIKLYKLFEVILLAFYDIICRVFVSQCDTCARLKQRTGLRYGHSTLEDTNQEITPWGTVNIDSVGPCSFIDHAGKELVLTALNIIYPYTRLF